MNDGGRAWGPRFKRVPNFVKGIEAALARAPDPHARRQDFAARVVRRLATTPRVAVIDDGGKPALVDCAERLYDLLAKDHPIVGVYAAGARIKHVIEDLEAAGL